MEKEPFAKLASFNKFALTPAENERLSAALDTALDFLVPLRDWQAGDTPLMVYAAGIAPVYRTDRVEKIFSREQILANAPEEAEHCFAVPRVAD